jgi:signal peptidase II
MTIAPSIDHKATKKDIVWILGVAGFVYLFDLATKFWAVWRLNGQPPIDIIPGVFRFAYGENPGIAFGMFRDHGGILHFLSPIAFIVLLVILYKMFAQNSMDILFRLIFGLLIGGALGNIMNRLYCGYVIDFIDVFIGTYNFPTFNIADSALTVGETILIGKIILEEFVSPKQEVLQEERPAGPESE